jgi:endonuclease/exonuclease/phosphatase family metal-dependent hydrolase
LAGVELRVLTWNLWHGRSEPAAGRDLLDEFAAVLGSWPWSVALLQEVPPWWPARLAEALDASERHTLTSRNSLLVVRRALATRWPDLIKSNGGGSNAILVRGHAIDEHKSLRLSRLPERRWLHAVRLGSLWVANLHSEASPRQAALAASTVLGWASGGPAVLGGDFNLRSRSLPGFDWAGGSGVDHVFLTPGDPRQPSFEVLDRGGLSDHAPVLTRTAWPEP